MRGAMKFVGLFVILRREIDSKNKRHHHNRTLALHKKSHEKEIELECSAHLKVLLHVHLLRLHHLLLHLLLLLRLHLCTENRKFGGIKTKRGTF